MKWRVLLIDNHKGFLQTRGEYLEKAGYFVIRANTIELAEEILSTRWIHLMIVDVRMRDNKDPTDESGLALAQKAEYRGIPKIILTEFAEDNYQLVVKAMRPAPGGLPPAVDFVAKQEGPEAMLKVVANALEKFVHVNWRLLLRWKEQLSPYTLVSWLEPEFVGSAIEERTGEVEDLLRRLFVESDEITVSHPLSHRDHQVALAVFDHTPSGSRPLAVVLDRLDSLEAELAHYHAFAPKSGHGGRTEFVNKEAATLRFAAAAFELRGADLERLSALETFYHMARAEMVTTTLDHLFQTTLAPWYKKGHSRESYSSVASLVQALLNLGLDEPAPIPSAAQLQALDDELLREGLARLEHTPWQLTLQVDAAASPLVLANPLPYATNGQILLAEPALCGPTHGCLDGNAVLTDGHGQTWLLYFSQAGQAPLLRDFVTLETAIKMDFLAAGDIAARVALEQRLSEMTHLDEEVELVTRDKELRKASMAILAVRQAAAAVVGPDAHDYQVGLFYATIGRLATYDPTVRHTPHELRAYLHALVSAALLCPHLSPLPPQALVSLWIDTQTQRVWVEGQLRSPGPQEWSVLSYLYQHAGQLCSRTAIMEEGLGVVYSADLSESEKVRVDEDRLNAIIRRLRKEIEPDAEQPRYIQAVRGEGYFLQLDPESD